MQVELLAGELRPRESKKAVVACNDYLRMGPGRSLAKLRQIYATPGPTKPPTRHLATLKTWSANYGWQERAARHDAEIERRKTEQVEARRRMALETGFALGYERVITLKKLAGFLVGQVFQSNEAGKFFNVWLADVKQVGSGEFAERVDIERFNAAIISELRGLLDDLARETGGRKHQLEHSGEIEIKESPLDRIRSRLVSIASAERERSDPGGSDPG